MVDMRPLWTLIAVLLLASAIGCGDEYKQIKNTPPPKFYPNIISLSPGTTEILARWGANNRLRGRTKSCNWPNYITRLPVVGDVKPLYEKILAMKVKPDLAVYDAALYGEADLAKMKEIGIELWGLRADSIEQFIEALRDLGSKISIESSIDEYVSKIQSAQALAQANKPAQPVTAVILMDGYIAGKDSFYADVVRAAGAEPLGPASNKFEKLSPESLIELNPDVILDVNQQALDQFVNATTNEYEKAKRADRVLVRVIRGELVSDPRWKSINAIKTRSIASVLPDAMLRKGGRVDVLITEIANFLGSVTQR